MINRMKKERTHQESNNKIKTFVGLFFGSEIKTLFNQSFEENQFYKASILAEAFPYFPDTIHATGRNHA